MPALPNKVSVENMDMKVSEQQLPGKSAPVSHPANDHSASDNLKSMFASRMISLVSAKSPDQQGQVARLAFKDAMEKVARPPPSTPVPDQPGTPAMVDVAVDFTALIKKTLSFTEDVAENSKTDLPAAESITSSQKLSDVDVSKEEVASTDPCVVTESEKGQETVGVYKVKKDLPKMERYQYKIESLLEWREERVKANARGYSYASLHGAEPYVKKRHTKQRHSKTKGFSWVKMSDRIKKCPPEEAEFLKFKILVQTAVNKFNKNNSAIVLNELKKCDFTSKEVNVNHLVDCIFTCVTRNGIWIREFAVLCSDLSRSMEGKSDYFNNKVVERFVTGSVVPESWVTNYEAFKSKKITTVEDLDEYNEELQYQERTQSSICVGSAKMLAFLAVCKVFKPEEAIKFINNLLKRGGYFSIEMICAFLEDAGCEIETMSKNCFDHVYKTLGKKKSTLTMKEQFLIEDIIKARATSKTRPKATVSVQVTDSSSKRGSDTPTFGSRYTSYQAKNAPSRNADSNRGFQQKPSRLNYLPENRAGRYQRDTKPGFFSSRTSRFTAFEDNKVFTPKKKPVEEPVVEKKFTYDMGHSSLAPLLVAFVSVNDVHALIPDLKELEIANHMDMFVRIVYDFLPEKRGFNALVTGQLFRFLIDGSRLTKIDFIKGFTQFMESYEDLLLDVPILLTFISVSLLPLIVHGDISLVEYYDILTKVNVEDPKGMLNNMLEELVKYTTTTTFKFLWQSSASVTEDILNDKLRTILHSKKDSYVCASEAIYQVFTDGFQEQLGLIKLDDVEEDCVIHEFVKVFHFFCLSDSEKYVDNFIGAYISEQFSFFRYVFESNHRTKLMFKHLVDVLQQRRNAPSIFIKFFINQILGKQLCDAVSLKSILKEHNLDIPSEHVSVLTV